MSVDAVLQAAREEEAADRASMHGRNAFEELKRMAAATISATPPGLRSAAPSGNGKEEEAGPSGNGRRLLLALGVERVWARRRIPSVLQALCLLPPRSPSCAALCSHGSGMVGRSSHNVPACLGWWHALLGALRSSNALYAAQQPHGAGMVWRCQAVLASAWCTSAIHAVSSYELLCVLQTHANDLAGIRLDDAWRCFERVLR